MVALCNVYISGHGRISLVCYINTASVLQHCTSLSMSAQLRLSHKPKPFPLNFQHLLDLLNIFGLHQHHLKAPVRRNQADGCFDNDLIKSGLAVVGVAKFLGCEKTLVKNPSEAVGPFSNSDRRQ